MFVFLYLNMRTDAASGLNCVCAGGVVVALVLGKSSQLLHKHRDAARAARAARSLLAASHRQESQRCS